MAYLLAQGGHRLPLAPEPLSFGSGPSNAVAIPDVYALAEVHFHIRPCDAGKGYRIEQAGSDQPTLVNGSPIESRTLNEGDVINAGKLEVVFHAEGPQDLPGDVAGEEPASASQGLESGVAQPFAVAPQASASEAPAPASALTFGGAGAGEVPPPSLAEAVTESASAPDKPRGGIGKKLLVPVAAVALLAGAAGAAMHFGWLDAIISKVPDDHFEFVERAMPPEFMVVGTLDLQGIIAAYPSLAAELDAPALDMPARMFQTATGVSLTSLDRLTFGLDPIKRSYLGVLSLSDEESLDRLRDKMEEDLPPNAERVAGEPTITFQTPMGLPMAIHAPGGRHLLIADQESLRRHLEGESASGATSDLIALMEGSKDAVAFGFSPEQLNGIPGFEEVQEEIKDVAHAVIGLRLGEEIGGELALQYKTEHGLKDYMAKVGSTKEEMLAFAREEFERAMPGQRFPEEEAAKIFGILDFKASGKVLRISARHPVGKWKELAMTLSDARVLGPGGLVGRQESKRENRARRDAQNTVSVYSAAIASGTAGFEGANSVDEIVALLREGVPGVGSFEGVVFQVPLSQEESREASKYMGFRNGTLSYYHDGAPADSKSLAAAKAAPAPGENPEPAATATEDTWDRYAENAGQAPANIWDPMKDANHIVEVYNEAIAAGATDLEGAGTVAQIVTMLRDGVRGTGVREDTEYAIDDFEELREKTAVHYLKVQRGQLTLAMGGSRDIVSPPPQPDSSAYRDYMDTLARQLLYEHTSMALREEGVLRTTDMDKIVAHFESRIRRKCVAVGDSIYRITSDSLRSAAKRLAMEDGRMVFRPKVAHAAPAVAPVE